MKKVLCIIAMVLMLTGAAFAQNAVISSGMSTSDRLIATGNCYIYGTEIIAGASTAVLSIYDAITASGTTVLAGRAGLADLWNGSRLYYPIEVFTGIYADVTGTGAQYTVYYKCK
jgi:hypothetical protein